MYRISANNICSLGLEKSNPDAAKNRFGGALDFTGSYSMKGFASDLLGAAV